MTEPPATAVPLAVVVWSDYLCPWCWLGHDRVALLRGLSCRVTVLPYELHPEVPEGGVARRPGGRLDRVFDIVEAECDELGLPFRRPDRTPPTRAVLETTELVRRHHPDAFDALHDACLRTHWVDGGALDDPATLDALVAAAGADPAEIEARRSAGEGAAALAESMTAAGGLGVTATPAFLFDGGLLVPGAQPRETLERWVTALQRRRASP